MTYWVYENWTHARVRVHRAECSHCRNGRGTQPQDGGRNGAWHGPFNNPSAAWAEGLAATLRRRRPSQWDVRACATCAPPSA